MKLLILCGVDNAGKSATIKYSTKYLGINDDVVGKFIPPRNIVPPRNSTPKSIRIGTKLIAVFLCSVQERTGRNVEEAVKILRGQIERSQRKQVDILIIPFNLESRYDDSIEKCLNEITAMNLQNQTFFVFLNADSNVALRIPNDQAKLKARELTNRGYNFIGEIQRIEGDYDHQGRELANYILQQL